MMRLFIGGSVAAGAIALFAAISWQVPDVPELLDRVAPPALSDRRPFTIDSASIDDHGAASVRGSVPGGVRLQGMRWYVAGTFVEPTLLQLDGDRFQAVLPLPGYRDAYPLFAYALVGGRHTIAMRDEIVVRARDVIALVSPAELAGQHRDPSIDARAIVDAIFDGGQAQSFGNGKTEIHVHDGARLRLVGWALDAAHGIPAARVEAVIDGRAAVAVAPDQPRPDVAAVYHSPSFTRCGFSLTIPSTLFLSGQHEIELRIVEGARYNVAGKITVYFSAM